MLNMVMRNDDDDSTGDSPPHLSNNNRKLLRPLVISMGGEREIQIRNLFREMKDHFEEPIFSCGITARSLRTRSKFFPIAYEAGLIPEEEYEALKPSLCYDQKLNELGTTTPTTTIVTDDSFYDALKNVAVTANRRGSEYDTKLHYSVELWRKAKGLNRGRSVLACTLAHLIAMKKCVNEDFDIILEDNVRAPMEQSAKRIIESIRASEEFTKETGETCHLRYFGWLGSIPNLTWVLSTHAKRMAYKRKNVKDASCIDHTVFPFPVLADFGDLQNDVGEGQEEKEDANDDMDDKGVARAHKTPGGSAIWGAYAYWISKEGYEALMDGLRHDVGALLWKGKRMRCHIAKPVDKVMPRQIIAAYGRESIHVATCPAFFRAPMLTSKIHAQWDPEFCKSTEYQLRHTTLDWKDLWLAPVERLVVRHKQLNGEWITTGQLLEMQGDKNIQD